MEVRGILPNFAPKFRPFSNLKAQILEIWLESGSDSRGFGVRLISKYLVTDFIGCVGLFEECERANRLIPATFASIALVYLTSV